MSILILYNKLHFDSNPVLMVNKLASTMSPKKRKENFLNRVRLEHLSSTTSIAIWA